MIWVCVCEGDELSSPETVPRACQEEPWWQETERYRAWIQVSLVWHLITGRASVKVVYVPPPPSPMKWSSASPSAEPTVRTTSLHQLHFSSRSYWPWALVLKSGTRSQGGEEMSGEACDANRVYFWSTSKDKQEYWSNLSSHYGKNCSAFKIPLLSTVP